MLIRSSLEVTVVELEVGALRDDILPQLRVLELHDDLLRLRTSKSE